MDNWQNFEQEEQTDNSDNNQYSDNYQYSDYYSEDDEEGKFQNTFNQERDALGMINYAEECASFQSEPGSAQFLKEIINKPKIEIQQIYINSIAKKLTENTHISIPIDVNDRNKMCSLLQYTILLGVESEHINALAYVLGYYIYTQGCVIEEKDKEDKKLEKLKKFYEIVGTVEQHFKKLEKINDIASDVRNGDSFSVNVSP